MKHKKPRFKVRANKNTWAFYDSKTGYYIGEIFYEINSYGRHTGQYCKEFLNENPYLK